MLPDIVEEHFDELDFLWELREANVFTSDWLLEDLAEHEERAEAHLDGLRLAELHAVDLAEERLEGDEPFAALAAALVLYETGEAAFRARIIDALGRAGPESVDGIRIAMRHCPVNGASEALQRLTGAEETFRAVAALDVLAFHRLAVERSDRLLAEPDPGARALTLGATARLGVLLPADVAAGASGPDPVVREAALRAAARSGMPDLSALCRGAASREADPDPCAVKLIGVLGDPVDLALLRSCLERPELAAAAVEALGAMGRVETVPYLLDLMTDDDLGVPATAAYRRITGADDVDGEKPFPPPEVAEGEDEQEELPPDPDRARADWDRRQGSMTAGVAWQAGFPVPDDRLPDEFGRLPLESRRDVYLRLRSRLGSRAPDLELEALATRQGLGR